MALTRLQARTRYIIGSVAQFLDRNLKTAYDAEVASLTFPKPLTIREGKPSDKGLILAAPSIAISTIGAQASTPEEVGSTLVYRHMNFVFHCFPATINGEPSKVAAELLKSYVEDAFGAKFIRVLDYSNGSFSSSNVIFCSDVIEVVKASPPVDRNATTLLAEEELRFDVHVSVRYPVSEASWT